MLKISCYSYLSVTIGQPIALCDFTLLRILDAQQAFKLLLCLGGQGLSVRLDLI